MIIVKTNVWQYLVILLSVLSSSWIFKMSVKTFENNGTNIDENIVKLKLEESIKFLLYNHLVYIYAEETLWQACQTNWEPTLTQLTVKGHNWVSLTYYDFDSYLVITRLVHKERLDLCNHGITQNMQFAETTV